ncbi:MAG: translation elongation factor Ts [Chloroflexota bacterium]|nr:translation elongation factor Ts [Chloroflexota bacterium]
MTVTTAMVKELRAATGAGVLDCKNALTEANGNFDEAVEFLRKQGLATAAKKASREANEGLIGNYVHMGSKAASMIEVNCETDFVARTDDFQQLVKDLAMQIVALKPIYVSREDIPEEVLQKEREIYAAQMADSGKPDHILDKIVEGKLEKYYQEVCLVDQPFAKDDSMTVDDLVTRAIAKLGENIVIRRFTRYEVGE